MSQDIFAAFGDSTLNSSPAKISSANGSITSTQRAGGSNNIPPEPHPAVHKCDGSRMHSLGESEDEFGDFEDAAAPARLETTMASAAAPRLPEREDVSYPQPKTVSESGDSLARLGKHPFAGHMDLLFSGGGAEYDAGEDDLEDLSRNPEAAMEFSKRIVASQQNRGPHISVPTAAKPQVVSPFESTDLKHLPPKIRKKSGYTRTKDPDVLFDADDAILEGSDHSEKDDFGDFEGEALTESIHTKPKSILASREHTDSLAIDFLELDDAVQRSPSEQATSTGKPATCGSLMQNKLSHHTSHEDIDDAWDDLEVAEPSRPMQQTRLTTHVVSTFPANPPVSLSNSITNQRGDSLPPTNIPPPAILLSIFPPLFSSAQQALLDPLSRLPPAQRQQLVTHPASLQLLRSCLSTAITLAHIIAGRKHRWKRDQYLAQGMRIGPAAAGGRSGMKLAGVDRSEVAKEDREVLDVLRHWRALVGKLRSAVATANANLGPKLPAVVEISEQMPVKVLKAVDGGFVAPQPCAVCGLRREERVAKVDMEINDSFGEWWSQSTSMHMSCRRFWEDNETKLRSR